MARDGAESPRLMSDNEREPGEPAEEENETAKFIADELKTINTASSGVDVDKRMLEGRKLHRGFTMSAKSSVPKDEDSMVDMSSLRNAKRAQTLPAMNMKRGDWTLSEDVQAKLMEQQAALQARRRRGSLAITLTIVPTEELQRTWTERTDCHVHGIMTEGQMHGDERERVFHSSGRLPQTLPPIIACQKGSKGYRDMTPNQDNYSITYFKEGYTLACTFDGHGPYGHHVSTRTVQTVPYFFINCEQFASGDIPAALIFAFESAQKDVVALALEEGWDVQASGSTAIAALWKDDQVWTANCGDSRCVIGSETRKTMVFATKDHKPDDPTERARIEACGGEVRSQTYPDGWVNHRIFVKGEDYPGLCMARTLGDASVKEHGVIATPEVECTTINLAEDPFLILASDGIWEFLDSEFVAKAVAKKIKSDGPERTVAKLQREAKKRWKQEEGEYCDDITSILVQLKRPPAS